MFGWFSRNAPIRTKFNVLTVLYCSYFAAAGGYLAVSMGESATSPDMLVLAAAGGMTLITALASKKMICDPYVATVVRMEGLAANDLSSEIQFTDHRDCVGRMTRAMEIFRANAHKVREAGEANARAAEAQEQVVKAISTGLAELSQGNLLFHLTDRLPGEYEGLRANFNATVDSLSDTISAARHSTNGVYTGAREIGKASDDLARRTERQAANLEEVTASMGEITSTVKTTAADAALANEAANRAREEAVQGGDVVRRAVEAMQGIERASNEIAEIISVIDGIAFQTNLLALNAGVEAARAGESGRGFAVVASEVRALAQRSADAARDISARIRSSTTEVASGVQLVSEAGQSLDRINHRVLEVGQLVSSMASAADTQAQGLMQVNSAVLEMDQVTQQNAAMVEEASAAARSLNDEATSLKEMIAQFNIGDDRFGRTAAPRPEPVEVEAQPRRLAVVGGRSIEVDSDWQDF
jgi:methyl-accepting chemotaxis protein